MSIKVSLHAPSRTNNRRQAYAMLLLGIICLLAAWLSHPSTGNYPIGVMVLGVGILIATLINPYRLMAASWLVTLYALALAPRYRLDSARIGLFVHQRKKINIKHKWEDAKSLRMSLTCRHPCCYHERRQCSTKDPTTTRGSIWKNHERGVTCSQGLSTTLKKSNALLMRSA